MGTSRNTGSDKQTYYKMNLSGDSPDSPHAMAEDFFRGKCVDGDNAYAEAALSVPSFLHLASLGVPFPVNRFGEYVGYKTDHDPRRFAIFIKRRSPWSFVRTRFRAPRRFFRLLPPPSEKQTARS